MTILESIFRDISAIYNFIRGVKTTQDAKWTEVLAKLAALQRTADASTIAVAEITASQAKMLEILTAPERSDLQQEEVDQMTATIQDLTDELETINTGLQDAVDSH